MKLSAIITVVLVSFVLTACSSNASYNVIKQEVKGQATEKEKMKKK